MTQWGLDTLFNPGKRHMDEEKRRLQATREEFGDSSGGRRIDLESGKVTIRRKGGQAETDDDTDTADDTAAESETDTVAEPDSESDSESDSDPDSESDSESSSTTD